MTYVCVLGRQPALGIAELESRFGAGSVSVVQSGIILVETEEIINFDHFGGVLKAAKLLTYIDSTEWSSVEHHFKTSLPRHTQYLPEAKITLGISAYGLKTNIRQINSTSLSVKKIIKKSGRPARAVPNKELALNTAQVLHNGLAGANGLELLLIRSGSKTILAQTKWAQNIDAYRRRDQERPMRDARVGMLPPKLAQIIINMATPGKDPDSSTVVLDPFCGTGVILQEALLMGYGAYGSDLDERMVEYAQRNLSWYFNKENPAPVTKADATSYDWDDNFDTIACETYLGRPFSSSPDKQTLQKVIQDVNMIHKKFLQNISRQTMPGFRLCIAVPAWSTKNGFQHLPVLDQLELLGYNRVSFVHALNTDLIYHREGQIVGRELVVLTRK